MDQLQTNVLAVLGELVLVVVRLGRCVALLGDVALGDEPGWRPVIGRIHLVARQHARRDQPLHIGPAGEHVDRHTCIAQVGDRVDVRIHLRIPHDHLRVLVQRRYHLDRRSVVPVERNRIGVRIRQRDVQVGVHLRNGVLAPDRRTTSSNLDVDPGINPGCHQRTGRCLLVAIDHVVVADHFVHAAVLGLGEPVGLDHHRGRTHSRQIGRCCGRFFGRCCSSGSRCRGGRRRGRRCHGCRWRSALVVLGVRATGSGD